MSCRESELSQFPNGFPLCGDKFTTLTVLRFFLTIPIIFASFIMKIFSVKRDYFTFLLMRKSYLETDVWMERLVPSFSDSLGSFMHFPETLPPDSDPYPSSTISSKPPKAPSRLQRFRPPPLTLPGESTDQRVPSLPQEATFNLNARYPQHANTHNRKFPFRTGVCYPRVWIINFSNEPAQLGSSPKNNMLSTRFPSPSTGKSPGS